MVMMVEFVTIMVCDLVEPSMIFRFYIFNSNTVTKANEFIEFATD